MAEAPLPRVGVELPPPFRSLPDDSGTIFLTGSTVSEVLGNLVIARPELRSRLFTPFGALRGSVAVFVNEEDIRYRQREATPLSEGDLLRLVPALAGG